MTYAIIEAGGHQLRIEVGRFYDIDYVPQSKPEAQLFFQRVLLLSYQTETIFGKPWIPGSYVRAKVLYHFQKKKVRVYKMRPKKKCHKFHHVPDHRMENYNQNLFCLVSV